MERVEKGFFSCHIIKKDKEPEVHLEQDKYTTYICFDSASDNNILNDISLSGSAQGAVSDSHGSQGYNNDTDLFYIAVIFSANTNESILENILPDCIISYPDRINSHVRRMVCNT